MKKEARKMNKNLLIAIILILIIGGFFILKSPQKPIEKKMGQNLGLKEGKINLPLYPGAKTDEEKCGKDAFYVAEKSASFVKNMCQFLQKNGWRLNHPDYQNCEAIKSFGGGYNYDNGQEKIAISVIKYGEDGSCYWMLKR